jgi:hypothetical protein
MVAYDPRGMTWDQYCKLMAELFAPNQLGYVKEENWRDWVDGLSGIGYFSESGIPDHRSFEHWNQWAEQVCGILSVTVGEI